MGLAKEHRRHALLVCISFAIIALLSLAGSDFLSFLVGYSPKALPRRSQQIEPSQLRDLQLRAAVAASASATSAPLYSALQGAAVQRVLDGATVSLADLWGPGERAVVVFLRHFG